MRQIKNPKRDSENIRITKIQKLYLNKLGGKTMAENMDKLIHIVETVKKNPEEICMNHIESFMTDLQRYYGDNHVEHFQNFPAVVRVGLKRGYLDFSIMKTGPNKSIDKFVGGKNE